ncbi:MAG TPA: hypothetical protein V6D25_12640 [Leptolyngbyaceae cyanobacterium]
MKISKGARQERPYWYLAFFFQIGINFAISGVANKIPYPQKYRTEKLTKTSGTITFSFFQPALDNF